MGDEEEHDPDDRFAEFIERAEGFAGIGMMLFQCFSAMLAQGFDKQQAMQITLKFMEMQFNMFLNQANMENT